MAFGSAITEKNASTNKRRHHGTFDCASVTGGDIDTGLRKCDDIHLQCKGSAVAGNAPAINEDLPCDGSAVAIVTDSGHVGTWTAWGY